MSCSLSCSRNSQHNPDKKGRVKLSTGNITHFFTRSLINCAKTNQCMYIQLFPTVRGPTRHTIQQDAGWNKREATSYL